jgi:hypothetical protein
MKKVFTMLAAAAVAGASGLAISSLAGASPDNDDAEGRAKARVKPAVKADRVLFARLKGRNEIGPNGRRGAGDLDGRGGFTALIAGDELCFGLTVDNIASPTGAHIHRGRRSENGPIVVTLRAPSSGDPGAASGCVGPDGDNTAVLREILRHPNHFYANVHTGDFPNGAVRGQLKGGH